MINKQNLWFLTLFSLVLVLGVYYVTLPNDVLESIKTKEKEKVVESIIEEDGLTALRVNKEDERKDNLQVLKENLLKEESTIEEKNNIYEQIKYLTEIQSKEEKLEKKIKQEFNLDCFIKIEKTNVSIICVSDSHNVELANNIMRMIQKNFDNKMNITVKFQKK